MSTKWSSPAAKNGRARLFVRRSLVRLGRSANAAIVPANLRALETVYFVAMLEESRLFDVVDRLVALFSQGKLAVGSGRAADILYQYWKAGHQLTGAQREAVYARAFGLPGADAGVTPNREFNDFWLRFLATVGMYAAELQNISLTHRSVTQEEVRRSGRDLAINLSLHGQGVPWFAAQDLKRELEEILRLLSDHQIQEAFGAGNLWQVVERVAVAELGANPNIRRARTRAETGPIIIRWLANRRAALLSPAPVDILKDEDIGRQRTPKSEARKRSHPSDFDLLKACEQWLAVTGTEEATQPLRLDAAAELP